ncbi:MAG TPA: NAD-dependent protein deacetylase [Gemmatimonadota bacterium]|nr:NAD-dependent protein deacetylase [Gemmatimonadota bacterium]
MSKSPALEQLIDLLSGRRLVVLTGAGCSTESGIPDYRGTDRHQRTPAPVRYGEFVRSREARRRYWARSAIGWPRMARARPNPGHAALAMLERSGLAAGVITQNVDGLHQAAGTRRLVELHGSLDRVACLECGSVERRADVQERLLALNPGWLERGGAGGPAAERTGADGQLLPDGDAELRPDGDADLGSADISSFRLPGCRRCGGILKPDVVFFGENVPAATAEDAWRLFGEGDLLLVAGSSLTVYSGYRFVRRAAGEGVPVAIVNVGSTRGDDLARLRVDGRTGEVLPRVADALLAERRSARVV